MCGTGLRVVDLSQFQNRELIADLEDLLFLAKSGEISGAVVVARFARDDHRTTVMGAYKGSPDQSLRAVFHMERALLEVGA